MRKPAKTSVNIKDADQPAHPPIFRTDVSAFLYIIMRKPAKTSVNIKDADQPAHPPIFRTDVSAFLWLAPQYNLFVSVSEISRF